MKLPETFFPQKRITAKDKFEKIMTSLRKWKSIVIHFEDIFL